MSHERVSARRRLPGQLGPPTDPDAACGLNHSSIRGLLLSPLLLLVALVTVLTAGTVSAAAAHGSETRVRAFDTPTANAVGQPSSETAGHVGCLRPVQPGFVSGSCVATEAAGETTRVGRWMSQGEFDTMSSTGKVVEGAGGRTFVVEPPNPGAYRATGPGSVYAEFDVPTASLRPAGDPAHAVIPGPNVTTKLYGPPPADMPNATCIVWVCRK